VLGAAALAYGYLLSRMSVLQERMHLLEYGVVALAFRAAFAGRSAAHRGGDRGPSIRAAVAALGATVAAGWLDEGIQALLPNRYYDIRDVGFNTLAGALALAVEAALDATRRREAGAHDAAGPADFL
jgi:VanZ family protein